jgi:hypothetical protein
VAKLVIGGALFGVVLGVEAVSPSVPVVLHGIELPHLNQKLYNQLYYNHRQEVGREAWRKS